MGFVVLPFLVVGAVATSYKVTGGHLNPVVTLANMLRKDKRDGFSFGLGMIYILAQFFGFLVGTVLSWWFTTDVGRLDLWKNANKTPQYSECISTETFYSFILVLCYLVVDSKETYIIEDKGIQAIFVGVTSITVTMASANQTGGSCNPWYALWHNIWRCIDRDLNDDLNHIWVYLVFPIVGAAIAWAVHQFVMLPAAKKGYKDENLAREEGNFKIQN